MKDYRRNLFRRIVTWVVAAHLTVIAALLIVPWIRGCRRKPPPQVIPIALNIAPPPVVPLPENVAPQRTVPREQPAATNQPPPRRRPMIEVSQERVERVRTTDRPPETPPVMTAEQLRELLTQSVGTATPSGTGTAIADADARELELIRQTLYQAWRQPAGHHLRGRVAEVELRLDAQGAILEYRVVRSSGDGVMDDSVRAVMNSVQRIPGLSSAFASRRPRVTVYFELAD